MHNLPIIEPQSEKLLLRCVEPTSASAAAPQVSATPDPTGALPPAWMTDPDSSSAPILLADDDSDDTYFARHLIRKTGVKNPIATFSDGSELVNFLGGLSRVCPGGRRRPQLLLFLDLKMAGLGGFGFLEWARQQEAIPSLKIVILSHSNATEDITRARELGAHRYLVKFPSVQTFSTIVRSVYPQTVF